MASNISSNPLEFLPTEIIESIFNHLPVKSLMTASLVSPDWYNVIARSQECMKKFKIKIKCDNRKAKEDFLPLIDSARRYENLEIWCCSECIHGVKDLFATTKKSWKRVKIIKTTFNHGNDALEYLGYIEKTVEELIMTEVYITNAYTDGLPRGFIFPKLKVFHAKHIQTLLFNEAFAAIKTLEQFALWSHNQSVASLDTIMTVLRVNNNLTLLDISSSVFNQVMYHDIAKDFEFRLKKLSVNSHYHVSEFHDQIQKNFIELLKLQSNTLEDLALCDWMGLDVLKVVYQLPNLTALALKGLVNVEELIDWKDVQLNPSRSIIKLNLQQVSNCFEMVKVLTDAVPNMTCLMSSFMNTLMLKHISMKHQNLCCLSIGAFKVNDASNKNYFKNLQRLHVSSCNRRLQERIINKTERRRSHFEKLINNLF